MSVVSIDLAAARTAVEQVSSQVEELLNLIPDTSVPVPRLEWTAGETGAHIVTVTNWFVDYATARKKPPVTTPELTSFNAERIAAFTERDGPRLAAHLQQAVQDFLTTTSGRSADDPFPWYDDHTIGVVDGTSILLGELVIHGLDLARAVDRPWQIDPHHARLVLAGMLSVLPLYLNQEQARGVRASYQIRVKGNPPVYMRFSDGELSVTGTPIPRVDCRITTDPVDYLLLSYGRIGQLRPILRGKLIAWGRKPWLGSKLGTLLHNP